MRTDQVEQVLIAFDQGFEPWDEGVLLARFFPQAASEAEHFVQDHREVALAVCQQNTNGHDAQRKQVARRTEQRPDFVRRLREHGPGDALEGSDHGIGKLCRHRAETRLPGADRFLVNMRVEFETFLGQGQFEPQKVVWVQTEIVLRDESSFQRDAVSFRHHIADANAADAE